MIRGYESELLAQEFSALGFDQIRNFSTIKEAYESAIQESDTADVIFIGGSTFTVADFFIQMDL